jgi:hypothetical protein
MATLAHAGCRGLSWAYVGLLALVWFDSGRVISVNQIKKDTENIPGARDVSRLKAPLLLLCSRALLGLHPALATVGAFMGWRLLLWVVVSLRWPALVVVGVPWYHIPVVKKKIKTYVSLCVGVQTVYVVHFVCTCMVTA